MPDNVAQIIPFYAHPHVHTVIRDHTFYDETVATISDEKPYSTCVVTGADKGIDNTFVRLGDYNTKVALFGKSNFMKYGQPSLQADRLFNGYCNVWLCRVLPDNATYANFIVLAHYRVGKILDNYAQETGLKRLEVKFSVVNADKASLSNGALTDDSIKELAESLSSNADPQTGYITKPIFYVRSIGRGNYGNNYLMKVERDMDAEKEYRVKMYKFSLLDNEDTSIVRNIFAGSLYQTTRYEMSTLISDVLDQFSTGSCPVFIHSFEDTVDAIFNVYKEVVQMNANYYGNSDITEEEAEALELAQNIVPDTFDPLFGIQYNSKSNDLIPYYRNYTVDSENPYVEPTIQVPSRKPLNRDTDWGTVKVGDTVLVLSDPLNDGYRWLYTVINVADDGTITYNDGVEIAIDADQYDGVDLTNSAGIPFIGGSDGDFEEVTVNGVTRAPTESEMKLLLAREYVKAFHGEKDKKILSPARIDLDFIFDANYNMTKEDELGFDTSVAKVYGYSSVLTDSDMNELTVLRKRNELIKMTDLNVKEAMWNLNEFRNKNGMVINPERGAGCHLHLDCGIIETKAIDVNFELLDLLNMLKDFTGRSTSIDLGSYEIFDPVSGKRIKVTATYFIASNLVNHIMTYGLNKPFTGAYAELTALQRNANLTVSGNMIRDSFRPDIDLINWDVKEYLFKDNRVNYYLTSDEGRRVQRATQNTRQKDASALLEENNMRVLNTLKKKLEKACTGYLYDWNEPEARKGYTDVQMAYFRPWIGDLVQDLNIRFEANEWEQERMIMHCYADVAFRDIIKRIILEININRPEY